jgi:hypothetical protein
MTLAVSILIRVPDANVRATILSNLSSYVHEQDLKDFEDLYENVR